MDQAFRDFKTAKTNIHASKSSSNFAAIDKILRPSLIGKKSEMDLSIFTKLLREERDKRLRKRLENPDASESEETPRTRISRIRDSARRLSDVAIHKEGLK